MLVNLHVKNLAIIDEVEVDFSDSLNVLTGETGAGKSIIIGSINLALGQKSPKDVIRKGAEYALVELTFRADTQHQRDLVREMGISMEEDEILISRKIMAGRSVNRINGESVTLSMIRRIADIMIDIHGQNEQQSLLHSAKHMEIVDRYAREELDDRLSQMEEGYRVYQELQQELSGQEIPEEERLREISFMKYELEEIEQAALVHGEEEARKAQEGARALFAGGGNTANMPEIELSEEDFEDGQIGILKLLVKAGLASSNGEARRNVEQGGVSIDGDKVTDVKAQVAKDSIGEDGVVLKRGKKKFMRVVVK